MNELLVQALEFTPLPVQLGFLLHYLKIRHSDFSGKLGITPATLSNWLSGKIRPKPEKYAAGMASLLDCPPELLIRGASLPYVPGGGVSSGSLVRKRLALRLSCGETARFLRVTDSQLCKWEKAGEIPDPFGSVLNALYATLSGEVFSRKENLSVLRFRTGLSVRELSRQLCVPEKACWRWEWQNALPLDCLNIFALYYGVSVSSLPSGPDQLLSLRPLSLKFLRVCAGITLRAMAGKYGFSSYQSYEDGHSVPDYPVLCRILDILGISPERFLTHSLFPSSYERLEFLRQTKSPLSETAVCRQMDLTPGNYRNGFLTARARHRFGILTDSLPFQLFLPLSSAENQVLRGDFHPEYLRQARQRNGLSAESVAASLMLSPVTVRAFENGTRQPSRYILRMLADRYSTGAATFFAV